MIFPDNHRKCKECETIMSFIDRKFCIHYSCDKCGYESIDWNTTSCYNDPLLKPTRYYKTDEDYFINPKNYSVYNQCQNCGSKVGTALKDTGSLDIETFDRELQERGLKERSDIKNLSGEIEERRKKRRHLNFEIEYEEYLKSERWKKIRQIVLDKDNNLCQSCLVEVATEVHHTDGQFRFNEPLFSLVSVCSDCHRVITEIERKRNAREEKKIKYKFDN